MKKRYTLLGSSQKVITQPSCLLCSCDFLSGQFPIQNQNWRENPALSLAKSSHTTTTNDIFLPRIANLALFVPQKERKVMELFMLLIRYRIILLPMLTIKVILHLFSLGMS